MKWKTFALILWTASVPAAIWAAKRLSVWDLDVFFNGISAGMLAVIWFQELTKYMDAKLARMDAELKAKQTELERLIWRIAGRLRSLKGSKL